MVKKWFLRWLTAAALAGVVGGGVCAARAQAPTPQPSSGAAPRAPAPQPAETLRLPFNTPGDWRIAADVEYESKRYSDLYNTPQIEVKPQTFVNASVSYTSPDQKWTGRLAVKNLFDLQQNQAGGYAPVNAGAQPLWYYAFNEPRMVNFTIDRKF